MRIPDWWIVKMAKAIKWAVIVCFIYHMITICILYFKGINVEYYLFGSPAIWGTVALIGSYSKQDRQHFGSIWRFYAIVLILIAALRQAQEWGIIDIEPRVRFATVIIGVSSLALPLGIILGKLSERRKYKQRYEKKGLRNEETRADNL